MDALIYPIKQLNNPLISSIPSKSLAHRAIICAGLAQGISTITNIQYSNDVLATIECLEKMGANVEKFDDHLRINGIGGINFQASSYYANESGSTLRFIIPILGLSDQEIQITGSGRLLNRPLELYQQIFNNQSLQFTNDCEKVRFKGPLNAGEFEIAGNVSSQFISGLLFALPLLNGNSKITILEPFESKSYVLMTIDVLQKFGIEVELVGNEILIDGNQHYQSFDYNVEGDYSQIANLLSIGALVGPLQVTNLNHNSLQGDKAIIDIFRQMSIKIDETNDGYLVYPLKPLSNDLIEIDIKNCPDLAPVLMALSAVLNKKTIFHNSKRLSYKESDRGNAMKEELAKFGVDVEVLENEIIVHGTNILTPKSTIGSHNDHRIFMACAVLATICDEFVELTDLECLNKSYPTFLDDLMSLGIKVRRKIDLENVLIVGLGMIGGSYAKGLAKTGVVPYAIDIRNQAIEYGVRGGFVKEVDDLGKMDLVILCLYPQDNVKWIKNNQHLLKDGCIITDVSGTKRNVVKEINQILDPRLEFIGSHPMAGRETSGVEASDEKIFRNANFIITPYNNTNKAIELIKQLALSLRFANIEILSIEEHDKVISYLSQLTHVIAVSLMNAHDVEKMIRYTGDSFRDLTRIAKINPKLWSELFLENKDYLVQDIQEFIDELDSFKKMLSNENREQMITKLNSSTTKRKLFDKK